MTTTPVERRRPVRRPPRSLGALALVAVTALGACGSGGPTPEEAAERWAEVAPASYTYRLASTCGEHALLGLYLVTVVDGEVTRLDGLDEAARLTATIPSVVAEAPSIEDLHARIAAEPDTVTEVAFEAGTGMPTTVDFDPSQADGDEECYALEDVDVLESPAPAEA